MTTQPSRFFRINDGHVAERKVRGEAILLPISNVAGEPGTVYDLNATATAIWDMIREGLSEGQIVERLSTQYNASGGDVAGDVQQILDHLLRLRIILPA